jgi:hypothetical protein
MAFAVDADNRGWFTLGNCSGSVTTNRSQS